ncbi:hypothetical protein F5Y16DRAFT_354541 [Xylariaceae sp. FL0255]|nr:hypothetical protein F5Y16DRAFT_354541 [Xylariaceae sp. FL0255]
MVRITQELALSPDYVTLYHATDPLLGHVPVLVFHGPSTTLNNHFNSSRVQVHIYTPAGFQSFHRLTISPNSPFYNAVNHLPREFQGDEIYRAIVFGLSKYFHELPDSVKNHLKHLYPTTKGRRPGSAPTLFGDQHAADLAKSLNRSENTADVVQRLHDALQTQHVTNVDVDLVLPPGSIIPLPAADYEELPEDEDDIMDPTLRQYGMYSPLVKLFGEPVFLPTTKLRRAPSKPSALNRTKSFSRDQKLELRRKMAELVETEERYVMKVHELVNQVAAEYRKKAKDQMSDSFNPSEDEVNRLFPGSSKEILQVNTAFMQALRRVMDETEESALKDVEAGFSSSRVGVSGSLVGKTKDASGAVAMARVMLEWFPNFTDCYQDYIRASQNFPQLITAFVNQQSTFTQRVALTGEQHLRSMVIEPVQRLPRYSLMIDQIVGCLPITHPALQPMLKARDIIANICSMDDPMTDKPHASTRLRNMIESWPADLDPHGRLITAADFTEVPTPYQNTSIPENHLNERAGIFLVFSDCIVMVKKIGGVHMTARDLLREIDKPSPAGLLASMTNAAGGPGSYDLAFAGWHGLADVRFTESADGRMTWMTSTKEMKGAYAGDAVPSADVTARCFVLKETYEGKSAKWGEDVVKARIENRFAEKEREDPTWTLRSVRMPDTGLGLHAAVFQEGLDQLFDGRKEPAPIRIVIDHEKGTKGSPVGHYGVEICSDVKTGDLTRVVVVTVGLHGKRTTDEVALDDFLPTLARRIIQLQSTQFNEANPSLTSALVSFNVKVLRQMIVPNRERVEKTKSFLGTSPVKYLSSFLTGSNSSDPAGAPKLQRSLTNESSSLSASLAPGQISRTNSTRDPSLYGSIKTREGDSGFNHVLRAEQTFTAYISILLERKGHVDGRAILNRANTDELIVSELCNKLNEHPSETDIPPEMGTEVVFAAFEKFIQRIWERSMGPIITTKALDALQERAFKKLPGGFADFIHLLFADKAGQNRRAFTSIIKILNALLEGCNNDSDRGALTLAVAELLAGKAAAPQYINLLDRLVEDCDRIFEEGGDNFNLFTDPCNASAFESMNSASRSTASYTPSLASNASSLRKKFGLGDFLTRNNSKTESDSRSSVWRSLSKHGRNPATGEPASLSRGSVVRTRSVDMNIPGAANKLRRPGSRDRPPLAGTFDDSFSRPNSSQKLETIGEPGEMTVKAPKKKRRSSLSDLKSLMAATSLADDDEQPLQPLSHMKETSEKFNSAPRGPSPSKIPISPNAHPLFYGSGFGSSKQKENIKENIDDPFRVPAGSSESPKKGHSKMLSTTNIPTLKTARTDPGPESPTRPTTSPSKTPGKLRLQSPQKLRERLQVEKKAVDEVDASLRSELTKISADMARFNSNIPRSATVDIRKLSTSVQALEERLPAVLAQLNERQDQLQRDMEETLKASDAKVKAIDQLYKESKAENELLHERFNNELSKILKAIKGKGREDKEEMLAKMKDYSEETARYKKENARLKREMVSLRSLIKGAGGLLSNNNATGGAGDA